MATPLARERVERSRRHLRRSDTNTTAIDTKWVYDFAEGSREMRNLLGGKGSGVAEMTRFLGSDLVPAGFTVTTEACVERERGITIDTELDVDASCAS